MTRSLLCAAVVALVPNLAHAAVGTIIEHRQDASVGAGVLRNGVGTSVSYRNADGWWVYSDGERRLVDADPLAVGGVWVVGSRAAFHQYQSGDLWFTDAASGRRLVGAGDACPNGTAETVLSVGLPFVLGSEAAYVQIRCANTSDIYLTSSAGDFTPVVYRGLPLAGLDASPTVPLLLATTNLDGFAIVSSRKVLFTGQSYECAPDPLCGNYGTFRVGGPTAALHISEAETPGVFPEHRAGVMSNMRANEMGEVAFTIGSEFSARITIYVWRPDGTVREVISTGDPAVGTGGSFATFGVDQLQIDEQGHVSFTASTTNGGVALWRETAAGLQRLLWPGQELLPDYPGSEVVSIDAVRSSRDGRLAAIITNGAGTLPSQAVLAQDLQGEMRVAWHRNEVIHAGTETLLIDGQAGFGDPPYGSDVHSNGMDGRGLVFADEGRLYIGIGGTNVSAAVVLELDANPNDGNTGGESDSAGETGDMTTGGNSTMSSTMTSAGDSSGLGADSSGSAEDTGTATDGSNGNGGSGGGGCRITSPVHPPVGGLAVLLLTGLLHRRSRPTSA